MTTSAPTFASLQTYFYELVEHLCQQLRGQEVLLARLEAEDSDFVRFNHAQVRHAMHVVQRTVRLQLVMDGRTTTSDVTLSGQPEVDRSICSGLLEQMRSLCAQLPPDPYLLYATEVCSSERHAENRLPPAAEMVDEVLRTASGVDMVGILARGGIFCGFANSLGQRNWFSSYSHNFDWSFYHVQDKAVKCRYAGFDWKSSELAAKMREGREQLRLLSQPARTILPGCYRVFLSPLATSQFVSMLGWGGFGLKSQRCKQTPLLKMTEEGARLHPQISLLENTADGVAPDFQDQGLRRPARVTLIEAGVYQDSLVSPRSAKEYGVASNGASTEEMPESLELAGGLLTAAHALQQLGTGLYVNNLWYLNFSDRPAGRITGMTRFATFWVEGGKLMEPVNVMRFDDTIYRVLGSNLLALTAERELILDARTFFRRSTGSSRMPGALVEDLTFTL